MQDLKQLKALSARMLQYARNTAIIALAFYAALSNLYAYGKYTMFVDFPGYAFYFGAFPLFLALACLIFSDAAERSLDHESKPSYWCAAFCLLFFIISDRILYNMIHKW